MQTLRNEVGCCSSRARLADSFLNKLSPESLKDFQSMEHSTSYPSSRILFAENDAPKGVFVVLEGEVKLSINSSDGKRLILRIARKGEVLGLVSALSGTPSEMTAETLYPSKLAYIERRDFLSFLLSHPEVYQNVIEELSRNYSVACEQLRTVGLSASVSEKLARLLLGWSEHGEDTDHGTRLHFPLTHEEIGEFIGVSRETVTRTLTIFKHRHLVAFHGAMLTIPSRSALESYACG